MSNAAMTQSISKISFAADPKQGILDVITKTVIDDYRLFDDDVMLGTYIRPERTKGGIILTDRAKEEDRFQGKVGLVLKKGPLAFKYDRSGSYNFEGEAAEVGDWVVYRASDGWEMSVNGVSCRIIRASMLRGVVSDPSVIW